MHEDDRERYREWLNAWLSATWHQYLSDGTEATFDRYRELYADYKAEFEEDYMRGDSW